jgi:hypothetical protein
MLKLPLIGYIDDKKNSVYIMNGRHRASALKKVENNNYKYLFIPINTELTAPCQLIIPLELYEDVCVNTDLNDLYKILRKIDKDFIEIEISSNYDLIAWLRLLSSAMSYLIDNHIERNIVPPKNLI